MRVLFPSERKAVAGTGDCQPNKTYREGKAKLTSNDIRFGLSALTGTMRLENVYRQKRLDSMSVAGFTYLTLANPTSVPSTPLGR